MAHQMLQLMQSPKGLFVLRLASESKRKAEMNCSTRLKIFWPVVLLALLSSRPVAAGLLLHYNFDGNVNDQSGNGNSGTIFGSPSYVVGAQGQALEFNNPPGQQLATQYVLLPNSSDILGLGAGSFTFYTRFKSAFNSTFNDRLFGVLNSGATGFIINISPGQATLYSSGGNFALGNVNVPPVLTDGAWHCLVVTVDRVNATANYYVDTNLIESESIAGAGNFSFANATVGRTNGGDGNPTWTNFGVRNAAVDDLQLYDHVLTPQEICKLCQSSSSPCVPEPSAFAIWSIGAFTMGLVARRKKMLATT